MGLYQYAQEGVCLPDTSEDSNESSSMSTITSSETSFSEGEQHRQARKNNNYFMEMQHYDACSRHEMKAGRANVTIIS